MECVKKKIHVRINYINEYIVIGKLETRYDMSEDMVSD